MRELLMDEYQYVTGGTDSEPNECDEIADDVENTIAADGIIVGAIATAIPGLGPIVGGAIAASALLAGDMLADEVREACEKHKEAEKNN